MRLQPATGQRIDARLHGVLQIPAIQAVDVRSASHCKSTLIYHPTLAWVVLTTIFIRMEILACLSNFFRNLPAHFLLFSSRSTWCHIRCIQIMHSTPPLSDSALHAGCELLCDCTGDEYTADGR